MFLILNRALSWAMTSFGNTFCLKKRSELIKALDNRLYVKFMQLEIGLLVLLSSFNYLNPGLSSRPYATSTVLAVKLAGFTRAVQFHLSEVFHFPSIALAPSQLVVSFRGHMQICLAC